MGAVFGGPDISSEMETLKPTSKFSFVCSLSHLIKCFNEVGDISSFSSFLENVMDGEVKPLLCYQWESNQLI